MRGVVERLVPAEGFGVIRGEDGKEYFLHANAMNRDDFSEVAEGWLVEFSVSRHHEGDRPGELDRLLSDYPAAIRVRRGDSSGLAEALRVIASSNGNGRADPALVNRYSRLRRAAEHADLLERLIAVSRENGAASRPPS